MTTALVISGGGDKGAFAVGAIEVLLQQGLQFDVISGTSTGALIAPLVAIDDMEEAVRIYTTVKKRDIIRWNVFGFWKAWYHTRPLKKLIKKTMLGRRYEKMMMSPAHVILCTVGYQTGDSIYYSQREEIAGTRAWSGFEEYVAATLGSTNQPLIMPPSILGGEQCWDGGVKEIAPTAILKGLPNLEKVFVVINSPEKVEQTWETFDSFATIGPRSLDIMTSEIIKGDLAEKLNISPSDVTVIRPSVALPTSGLEFIPELSKEMRVTGQKEASRILC